MHQEDSLRYLIVVEIERKGFLVDIVKGEMVANERIDSLVILSNDLTIYEMDKMIGRFEYFGSYTINGSDSGLSNFRTAMTNGVLTVAAVPIDLATFCAKTFIREREYYSDAIEFSDYPDEVAERLLTMFPHFSSIAN